MEMNFIWIMALIYSAPGFVTEGLGRECNVTHVSECYEYLEHFKTRFPFYGEDVEELDETCKTMNDSIECHEVYSDLCRGRAECGKSCQKMIADLDMYFSDLGPAIVHQQLCDKHSSTRQVYLENYPCLYEKTGKYTSCISTSVLSNNYINSIDDPEQKKAAGCCFFTWYHGCYENVTHHSCNESATEFVSSTLNILLSHTINQLCGSTFIACEEPPLPSEFDDKEEDKKEVVNNINVNKTTIGKPDEHPKDKQEHKVIKSKSAGTSLGFSFRTIVIAMCCILFLKYTM